jgi:membrane-bound ClpP family serine protease
LAAASIRAAAPGTRVGYLEPMVAGGGRSGAADRFPEVPGELMDDFVVVDGPIPGLVDLVQPSVGQLIVAVDGMVVELESGPVQLQTARQSEDPGTGPAPAVEVRFDKGSLFSRVFRVAIRPEAAYLFLVVGLALAVFEFYAAGVGVMAAVAVLALLVGGYGVVALPVRWWAVGLTLVGLGLYTADFQRHDLGWRSILGTAALLAGGLWFVDAAPQFGINWWAVLGVVAGAALFFGVGMTAVVRSRFSTATIGRDHLIGRLGAAATDFDPTGVVDLDGARWQATSRRAAGIEEGDGVEVIAVSGIVLEVEPVNLTDVRE